MEPSPHEMKDEAAAPPARRTSDNGIEIEGPRLETAPPPPAPRSPRGPAASDGAAQAGRQFVPSPVGLGDAATRGYAGPGAS